MYIYYYYYYRTELAVYECDHFSAEVSVGLCRVSLIANKNQFMKARLRVFPRGGFRKGTLNNVLRIPQFNSGSGSSYIASH